jgi:hypothetical protein
VFNLIRSLVLALGAILLWTTALAFAADSWLMTGHDAAATNFNSGERAITRANVARLHTVWSYSRVVQAIASDKRVYAVVAGSTGSTVAVLDAGSGKLVRTFGFAALALAYARSKLLIATTSAVSAVDPIRGRVYWRTPGGAGVLAVRGGTVYTGKGCQNTPAVCGTLASYALDVQTGKVLWQHPGNGGGLPVLIAGRLFQPWGMFMPETRVYDPATGQLAASLPLTASWTGDARNAYADALTAPGKGWWLGQISATGKPAWKISLGAVVGQGNPVFAYGTLYASSNRFHPGVLAVNARNGQVQWGADLGSSLRLIAANRLLYVLHQTSGRIDVLDAGTGIRITQLAILRFTPSSSAQLFISGQTLYVIDGSRLTALQP